MPQLEDVINHFLYISTDALHCPRDVIRGRYNFRKRLHILIQQVWGKGGLVTPGQDSQR